MKVRFFIHFAALIFFLCVRCDFLHADMIDVKGKGAMNGSILKEDKDTVTFKDSHGHVETYLRSDIAYTVKENAAKPLSVAMRDILGKPKPTPSKPVKASVELPKSLGDRLPRNLPSWGPDSEWVGLIKSVMDKVSQALLDFLTGDAQKTTATVQNAIRDMVGIKNYTSKNYAVGFTGMILMGVGAIAVFSFGLQLVFAAFEQSFGWGLAFLGNGLAVAAPMLGGAAGLVLLIPQFMSFCFVLFYWEAARKPVVCQLFSANVVILGYLILKSVS